MTNTRMTSDNKKMEVILTHDIAIISAAFRGQLTKLIAVNGWNKTERRSTISGALVGWDVTSVDGEHRAMVMFGAPHTNAMMVVRWDRLDVKPHEIVHQ